METGLSRSQKVTRRTIKFITKHIRETSDKLDEKRTKESFVKKIDKFQYIVFLSMFIVTFMLTFYPKTIYLARWVVLKNFILIMIRFYRYKNRSWHYYLFDYCYFVNLLNTFVILFEPKNKYLFFVCNC